MIQQVITFDGGLSTKVNPHLIQRNEGIVCENVELETGSLTPLHSFEYVANVAGKHIYNYNQTIISSTTATDDRFYDIYGGRAYWTDGEYGTYGLMRYNDTNAGVDAEAPTKLSTAEVDTLLIAESANNGMLTEGATYIYAFTVVDADGIESAPEISATEITMVGNKNTMELKVTYANMATIQANHPDMVGINIYRTGGNNPTFNIVAENMLPTHPNVSDNGTHYVWLDTVADIDVSRIELYTFENTPPPERLDMLIECNGTMWGSVDNNVYFSRTGSPEYWGLLDYVRLDKECTGLGKFGDSVVAFTRTSAYLISGSTRDDVNVQRLPFNHGCVNKHSVVNIDGFLLWTSLNGVCIFNGSSVEVITKKSLNWDEFRRVGGLTYADFDATFAKWDAYSGFEISYAVGYKDKYYGVFSDGILFIDISNGVKVATIRFDGVETLAINEEDNLLYALKPNITSGYDVYYLPTSGSNIMTARWKTPRLADNSTDVVKHYRDVELEAMPVSVEVFVNGVSVKTYTGKRQFKLPAGTFGKDIQFDIRTTNEIRSLKYEYNDMKA